MQQLESEKKRLREKQGVSSQLWSAFTTSIAEIEQVLVANEDIKALLQTSEQESKRCATQEIMKAVETAMDAQRSWASAWRATEPAVVEELPESVGRLIASIPEAFLRHVVALVTSDANSDEVDFSEQLGYVPVLGDMVVEVCEVSCNSDPHSSRGVAQIPSILKMVGHVSVSKNGWHRSFLPCSSCFWRTPETSKSVSSKMWSSVAVAPINEAFDQAMIKNMKGLWQFLNVCAVWKESLNKMQSLTDVAEKQAVAVRVSCSKQDAHSQVEDEAATEWYQEPTSSMFNGLLDLTQACQKKHIVALSDKLAQATEELEVTAKGGADGKSWKEGIDPKCVDLAVWYGHAKPQMLSPKFMGSLRKAVLEAQEVCPEVCCQNTSPP